MMISLIVAYSQNLAIGKDNKLLWHLSDDLKNFKKVTSNHCIIMGRKTYESIGFALPNRTNIVVTRNKNFVASGCIVVQSLEDAIDYAKSLKETEVIITGGEQIYKQSLDLIHRAYITHVECQIEDADAFFPQINFDNWKRIESFSHPKDAKNDYPWTFNVYEKI